VAGMGATSSVVLLLVLLLESRDSEVVMVWVLVSGQGSYGDSPQKRHMRWTPSALQPKETPPRLAGTWHFVSQVKGTSGCTLKVQKGVVVVVVVVVVGKNDAGVGAGVGAELVL